MPRLLGSNFQTRAPEGADGTLPTPAGAVDRTGCRRPHGRSGIVALAWLSGIGARRAPERGSAGEMVPPGCSHCDRRRDSPLASFSSSACSSCLESGHSRSSPRAHLPGRAPPSVPRDCNHAAAVPGPPRFSDDHARAGSSKTDGCRGRPCVPASAPPRARESRTPLPLRAPIERG